MPKQSIDLCGDGRISKEGEDTVSYRRTDVRNGKKIFSAGIADCFKGSETRGEILSCLGSNVRDAESKQERTQRTGFAFFKGIEKIVCFFFTESRKGEKLFPVQIVQFRNG